MSLQPQQGDGIATWFPAACVSPGVFFSGCPRLQLLSSPSAWFHARLVLSTVALDRAAPQLPHPVVPYWGLYCSLRAAPDTQVCQGCPSRISQQPLALYWVSWELKCYRGSVVQDQHHHLGVQGACLCNVQSCLVWASDSSFSHAQQDTDLDEKLSRWIYFSEGWILQLVAALPPQVPWGDGLFQYWGENFLWPVIITILFPSHVE